MNILIANLNLLSITEASGRTYTGCRRDVVESTNLSRTEVGGLIFLNMKYLLRMKYLQLTAKIISSRGRECQTPMNT